MNSQGKDQRVRFLHLAFHIHQQLFFDGMMISGFYNWHRVFEAMQNDQPLKNPNYYGKFGYWHQEEDHLNDYDIIFIGISSPELIGNLASSIREKIGVNSKTKLVANVDYAVEMWPQAFNLTHLRHELLQCDYIFAAENAMVSHLEALTNRKIHSFSHPTDIRQLKNFGKPIDQRNNRMLSVVHRYDNNWQDLYLATKDIAGIENHAVLLDPSRKIDCLPYFKYIVDGLPYPQFIDMLSKSKLVADSYHKMHSYGRIPVECACLRVPVVSTDWVTSALNLWPETTILAGDVNAQKKMLQKLLTDPVFYKKVTDYAYDAVEACGYEAAITNFMNMVNGKDR